MCFYIHLLRNIISQGNYDLITAMPMYMAASWLAALVIRLAALLYCLLKSIMLVVEGLISANIGHRFIESIIF